MYSRDMACATDATGWVARLREARDRADISYREADMLAGLALGHSYKIINGLRVAVEVRSIAAICRVFGYSLDYIVLGKGRPPSRSAVAAAVHRARLAAMSHAPRARCA
jgi:hypothetical protein